MSKEKLKEAVNFLLSEEPVKGFETLARLMETRSLEALQEQMIKVGKEIGGTGTIDEGYPSRKHFQQVADTIKHVEDPAKRKELAQHHAAIFKSQNPRFDHSRFYAAAGVNESEDPQKKSVAEVKLDEISKRTLGSYVKNAADDYEVAMSVAKGHYNRAVDASRSGDKEKEEHHDRSMTKWDDQAQRRRAGIAKAVDRLTKEDQQIDELTRKTMKSYQDKATTDASRRHHDDIDPGDQQYGDPATRAHNVKKLNQRLAGRNTAERKINKSYQKDYGDV